MGDKILLFETLGLAASGIQNQQAEKKTGIDFKSEKEFFGVQDHPIVLAGRITKRMKATKVL